MEFQKKIKKELFTVGVDDHFSIMRKQLIILLLIEQAPLNTIVIKTISENVLFIQFFFLLLQLNKLTCNASLATSW